MIHVPVLKKEVLENLNPKENQNFIDATIGNGGHAIELLKRTNPRGRLLGIDQDPEQIKNCEDRIKEFQERVVLANDNFRNLKEIAEREKFEEADGILFDLGMSSWHLEKSGKGFSFNREEPLDMRYNANEKLTAQEIVNNYPERELEKILREYGEERFAKRIASQIIKARELSPIKSTFQLVEIIKKAIPSWYQYQKIHFATRTFQAIRIETNKELDNLKLALPQVMEVLKSGSRLVVLSFHSLEDRIVKNFLKENSRKGLLKIITKKPIIPAKEEVKENPRSRSAKLRAAIII